MYRDTEKHTLAVSLLLCIILMIISPFAAFAVVESIQYRYDNEGQVRGVQYDDGTVVDYLFDTSGNRISKTVVLPGAPANTPPTAPVNLAPAESAADVDAAAVLSWTAGSDSDAGDIVTYDIHLGKTSPPPLYRRSYELTSLTTFPLQSYTTYYWQVVARDPHNASAPGSIWHFTTGHIPVLPTADAGGPYFGAEGQQMALDGSFSNDPDGWVSLYEWDIDDDGTYDHSSALSLQNHTYSVHGTYTVRLRVTDNEGAASESVTTAVISDTSPIVSFIASPLAGTEPLLVDFTDTSSAYDGISNRYWYFGDGSASSYFPTGQHTYIRNGSYVAHLMVQDSDGSTESSTVAITVYDTSPSAGFTADVTGGAVPLSVNFSDSSTGYDQPLTFDWDFDNNGTIDSVQQHPSHVYTDAGLYTVRLTTTDADGSVSSLTLPDYITACYPAVHVPGDPASYSLMQSAYDAARDQDTLQGRDVILAGDLNVNRHIAVTIRGGYDCLHSASEGMTTIEGNVTISDGTVIMENIIIE